uniref:C2H2-type domain-containing protein n=1 Tax=Steinernema glaseri TaxID=37863 RepID=A0A1I7YZ28_9BILA
MCDPWTWDSLDMNVLEGTESSNHPPNPQEVVYEFPFEIATTTESETESSSSRSRGEKAFQCAEPGCGLSFMSKSSLNRHWRTKHEHGGLAKFSCPECEGVSFNYHSDLLVHQRASHEAAPPAKRSIPCLQCTAMFRNTADLDTHIARVHERLKTHECIQCHEKFDREFTLQMHIKRRHSIRRDYQCPYCRKMFANLYDLVHFHAPVCSTPRDYQPYKCALCPQAYRHATSLSRHKRFAHSNPTIADVRQSQLKLVVCGREQRPRGSRENHAMMKTIEDRTLGSIRGLFAEQPAETQHTPTMDISGDLNRMFTQNEFEAEASISQAYPVWSSTYESDFSDSAISSMEGFLSG